MTLNTLIAEVKQLSVPEKWQIVKEVLHSLETEQDLVHAKSDWHQALRATYGILADDPIERPEQLPLEEREPIE